MSFEFDFAEYIKDAGTQERFDKWVASSGGSALSMSSNAKITAIAKEAIKAIIASLPASLRESPNGSIDESSLRIGEPEITKEGHIEVGLQWNASSVKRDSLYLDGDYEPIEDVVHLLTTGYTAKKYAYGIWSHHADRAIRSKMSRPAQTFLQDAISAFNAAHQEEAIKFIMSDFYLNKNKYGI